MPHKRGCGSVTTGACIVWQKDGHPSSRHGEDARLWRRRRRRARVPGVRLRRRGRRSGGRDVQGCCRSQCAFAAEPAASTSDCTVGGGGGQWWRAPSTPPSPSSSTCLCRCQAVRSRLAHCVGGHRGPGHVGVQHGGREVRAEERAAVQGAEHRVVEPGLQGRRGTRGGPQRCWPPPAASAHGRRGAEAQRPPGEAEASVGQVVVPASKRRGSSPLPPETAQGVPSASHRRQPGQ